MLIAIIVILVLAGFIGGVLFDWYVPFPRMLLHDKGHRVFLVANEEVLWMVLDMVRECGNLKPILKIDSGGTHQTLMSDGTTVFMWVDKGVDIAHGGFTFTNNDRGARKEAIDRLISRLQRAGYKDAKISQPDRSMPHDTLLLASSPTAFPGGDIGFRPDTLHMMKLAPSAARKL